MSLTKEQAMQEAYRGIELHQKVEKLKVGVHRAKVYMFIALFVGIFFFPALVIALICFAIFYLGGKQVEELSTEVQRLEATPEVMVALDEIIAENGSNP